MKQLAFIADDFGLSTEINEAILLAYREGALTGASLMLGQPATDHALELARATPGLEIGWHLHLCDSRPTTRACWPWGASPGRAGLLLGSWPGYRDLVRAEIRRQWELFQLTGLPCQFFNSHHHLHLHPWVNRELAGALTEGAASPGWFRGYDFRRFQSGRSCGWIPRITGAVARLGRGTGRRRIPHRHADSVWGIDRLFRMDAGEVVTTAAALPMGLHEFCFHPRVRQQDADLDALLKLRRAMAPAAP